MSETANVQLIRQLYETMGKGDLDAVLAMMTDDVTFVVPGPPGLGAAGTWRGHKGVRTCFVRLRDAQDNQQVDVREIVAQGNTVVVLLHAVARIRSTGKTFESDIAHYLTIRNGRIASLLDFFDTAALVEAYRE
jgi:ketosteroid isomerase-like protein